MHTLLGVTWGFFGTILNVLIIVVLSLYWSIDRVHFERLWLSLLGRRAANAHAIPGAIEHATGAYLQREAVQSLSAGCMLGIGFWLLQQPYPVLSAAIGALAWLIPWSAPRWRCSAVTAIWFPRFLLVERRRERQSCWPARRSIRSWCSCCWNGWSSRAFSSQTIQSDSARAGGGRMVDWLGFFGLLIAPPVAAAVQILGAQFLAHRAIDDRRGLDASPRALAQQLATLQARMADAEGVSEETQAVVARLDALVEQARRFVDRASSVPAGRRLLDKNRT